MKTSGLLSFVMLLSLSAVFLQAEGQMNAMSKLLLEQRNAPAMRQDFISHDYMYQAFIAVSDSVAIESLQRSGVMINSRFDGYVTATIPSSVLTSVAVMNGVKCVALSTPLHLCNDSARFQSHVDWVHESRGLVAPITGKNVIVGIIDTGIDFNHINLCDTTGHSRVVAAYLPCDTTGTPPIVDGLLLPGSCYETPNEIALLTTDNVSSSHGTHTTGTAAGCCRNNGLYGVAVEADIVACGMPSNELTDVNLANALNYIFDYADRAGKPCVVNMSLGSNSGPNDGTSFLCRTFESLSGPGRICVLSAGNDGNSPIRFHYDINGSSDTVTTLLRHRYGGSQRYGYVSMWSNDSQEHRTRIVVINRQTGNLEYASPMLLTLPEDSVYVLSSDNDPAFATYYSGEILFANALEPQFASGCNDVIGERFHSLWSFDVEANESDHLLGLQYVSDDSMELVGWCTNNTYFYTFGLEGITGGSSVGSISDLVTTDSVISVGAYCTRDHYFDAQGEYCNVAGSSLGDIAYFSSYGPDERGVQRPDVCAPGFSVLSSASRYNQGGNKQHWLSPVVADGIEYPYYSNMGTSMSAPVVTGCIALMLQLDPSLTVNDVRRVLRETSRVDSFVTGGDANRWGTGKLDCWAAVDYIARHPGLPGDVNGDGEITVADIMVIVNIILGKTARVDAATLIRADVNHDNEIVISDVDAVINKIIY